MSGAREEEYEVLDLTALGRNRSAFQRFLGDVSKQSVAKQIVIGGAAGWISGYMTERVGKAAVLTIGGTILTVRIAQHQGYIQINWRKVNKEMEDAKRKLEREARRNYPRAIEQLQTFIQQNMFLAGSFAGGFFLGLAF